MNERISTTNINTLRNRRKAATLAVGAAVLGGVGFGVDRINSTIEDADAPKLVKIEVQQGDTMSGLVEEVNPGASPDEVVEITDDALRDNGITTSYGMQADSIVEVPAYPEYTVTEEESTIDQ